MGYSTDFTGELKFKRELISSELAKINKFINRNDVWALGYNGMDYEWRYMDLKLTDDFSGIKWDGAEKTYGMLAAINFLIDKSGIDLQLEGELLAQGDDHDDRWKLVMKDNRATKVDYPRIGQRVTCPICEGEFTLEGES